MRRQRFENLVKLKPWHEMTTPAETQQLSAVDALKLLSSFTEPLPSDMESCYVLGVHKGGSTLFNGIFQRVSKELGLPLFSLPSELQNSGIATSDCPVSAAETIDKAGVIYGGFRGFNFAFSLPERATGRVVALVRDPRDCLVSLYFSEAYSHQPPGAILDNKLLKRFEERRSYTKSISIDQYVLERAAGIRFEWDQLAYTICRHDPAVWRYEDVVFDKLFWTRELMDHLGIDIRRASLQRICKSFDKVPSVDRPDDHVRQVKPGDHQRKLTNATIKKLDLIFADYLDAFDYR